MNKTITHPGVAVRGLTDAERAQSRTAIEQWLYAQGKTFAVMHATPSDRQRLEMAHSPLGIPRSAWKTPALSPTNFDDPLEADWWKPFQQGATDALRAFGYR
jgi:hypothetical protein